MSNNCKHAESEGGGGGGVRRSLYRREKNKNKELGGWEADPCSLLSLYQS